jgi:AraC-like DNA-binding protein
VRRATIDEFVARPVGCWAAGTGWLYFHPNPSVCGFLLWGRPGEEDVRELSRALRIELSTSAVPHVSLVDVRGVEGIDPAAFRALSDYVKEHAEPLGAIVTKLALVRSSGYMGALAEGFFRVLEAPYPIELFDELPRAIEWLKLADGANLAKELDDLAREAAGVSRLLRDLRGELDRQPGTLTLARAARLLAVSERSLQRELQKNQTSFRREVGLSQVRVAMTLMVDGDAKLSHVAHEVGCASLSQFSALFRRVTGLSPSAWRQGNRN